MSDVDAMLMFVLIMIFAEVGLAVYLVYNLAQALKWFFFKVGTLIYQTKKIRIKRSQRSVQKLIDHSPLSIRDKSKGNSPLLLAPGIH